MAWEASRRWSGRRPESEPALPTGNDRIALEISSGSKRRDLGISAGSAVLSPAGCFARRVSTVSAVFGAKDLSSKNDKPTRSDLPQSAL